MDFKLQMIRSQSRHCYPPWGFCGGLLFRCFGAFGILERFPEHLAKYIIQGRV